MDDEVPAPRSWTPASGIVPHPHPRRQLGTEPSMTRPVDPAAATARRRAPVWITRRTTWWVLLALAAGLAVFFVVT
jgi:hypothetical protein